MGLEIQQDQIQAYLQRHPHLKLVKTYRDEGISGSRISRPGLDALLADAKAHLFTRCLVARYDRVARELALMLFVEKTLLVEGVELISVSESFNGQDPVMVAMRQIIGVFAQLERGRITERLWSGRRKRLSMGLFAGGSAPLGYRLTDDSELVVEPKAAETVRLIFKLRDQGLTYKELAAKLNADGIKPRFGKQWWPSTVAYICANRAKTYAGLVRYGETKPGAHKPIIP